MSIKSNLFYLFIFSILLVLSCVKEKTVTITSKDIDKLQSNDESDNKDSKKDDNDKNDLLSQLFNYFDKEFTEISTHWPYVNERFVSGNSSGVTKTISLGKNLDKPLSNKDKEALTSVLAHKEIGHINISQIPHKDFLELSNKENFSDKIIYEINSGDNDFRHLVDEEKNDKHDQIQARLNIFRKSLAVKNIKLYLSSGAGLSDTGRQQIQRENTFILQELAHLTNVKKLIFYGDFNKEVIEHLNKLTKLKNLIIKNSTINTSTISLTLPSINSLELEHVKEPFPTAKQLAQLFPNMNKIEIAHHDSTINFVTALGDFTSLKKLAIISFEGLGFRNEQEIDNFMIAIGNSKSLISLDLKEVYWGDRRKRQDSRAHLFDAFVSKSQEFLAPLVHLSSIKLEPYVVANQDWRDFYNKLEQKLAKARNKLKLAPIKLVSLRKDKGAWDDF
jgi:hypothetical protein